MAKDQSQKNLHLKNYLEIIRRRRWIVVAFFVILVTTVALGTLRQTPTYRATAVVLIEKESPQALSFKDVITLGEQYDYKDYYETQLKIIKSRSIGEKVVAKLGLSEKVNTEDSSSALVSTVKGWVGGPLNRQKGKRTSEPIDYVEKFLSTIGIEPIRNSRLVKIISEGPSPEEVARAVNTLAEVYVQENLTRKIRASQDASDWIYKELEVLKKKVEESERALEQYKKETAIISLEKSQDIVIQKLAELNTAFTEVQIETMRAEVLYEKVKQASSQGKLMETISEVAENRLIHDLKVEYAQLESSYNKLSNVYKPEHPEMIRLKFQMEQMKRSINTEIEKVMQTVVMEYEVAKSRQESLRKAMEEHKKKVQDLNEKAIQYRILSREAETNQKMYNTLLERLKEVKLSSGTKENNIMLLDRAEVPTLPFKPSLKVNLLVAVLVGMVAGTGLAFFTEYVDTAVKGPEEIKEEMQLPLLATIPNISGRKDIEKAKIALQKRRSNVSEAYRNLRTSLRFLSPDKVLKNILVTSAAPQEGKTLTLTNLGIALAQAGSKVLLVDGDLRRPALGKVFALDRSMGLTNFLVGESDSDLKSIIQTTEVDNLNVVTAGKLPPNPSELLDSQKMREFFECAGKLFDVVLYDSPPLAGMSDSIILANLMDGVIQVVRSGKTPKDLVLMGKEILTNANVQVIGVVLNDVNVYTGGYYYHYHYYHNYYGERDGKS